MVDDHQPVLGAHLVRMAAGRHADFGEQARIGGIGNVENRRSEGRGHVPDIGRRAVDADLAAPGAVDMADFPESADARHDVLPLFRRPIANGAPLVEVAPGDDRGDFPIGHRAAQVPQAAIGMDVADPVGTDDVRGVLDPPRHGLGALDLGRLDVDHAEPHPDLRPQRAEMDQLLDGADARSRTPHGRHGAR